MTEYEKALENVADDAAEVTEEIITSENKGDDVVTEARSKFFVDIGPEDVENFYVPDEHKAVLRACSLLAMEGKYPFISMEGPTGCGKTSTPEWFAVKSGRPLFELDCPTVREAKDVFGSKEVVPDGNGGLRIVWRKSAFVEAVSTPGAVILLDEINRIHPSATSGLIPLLDHRRRVYLDDLGEEIRVAENVIFFATANVGSQYTGTYKMDAAFRNRVNIHMVVDYLDEEHEIKVIVDKTGIDSEEAKSIVSIANIVREKVRDETDPLTNAISTRQVIKTAELRVVGMPLLDAMQFAVLNSYSKDGGDDSEYATVAQIVQGKLARN